jgi:hypothetical protein
MSENFVAVNHHRRELLGLACWLGLAPLHNAEAKEASKDSSLQWGLSNAKIVSQGRELELLEGILHQDFVLEADAQAVNTEFMPAARFKLVLQAFRPTKDFAGQVAGRWYLKGVWSLQDPSAVPATEVKKWNQSGVLKSQFLAETTFDPRLASSQWRADFNLPPGRYLPVDSASSGFLFRGQGALAIKTGFEGTLSLALR